MVDQLAEGFEIINDFLTADQLLSLQEELKAAVMPGKAGGIRNLEKKFRYIDNLANSTFLLSTAGKYLHAKPSLVRVILFDKNEENNWFVTWHQDRTVAVSKTFDQNGWGPWSKKDGVFHVQPPIDVLRQMITVRIHLDDANDRNGCLKIIPASQHDGLLSSSEIEKRIEEGPVIPCEVKAGGAVVMRPHVLHSSSKANAPSSRRVVHIEYSDYILPPEVAWA